MPETTTISQSAFIEAGRQIRWLDHLMESFLTGSEVKYIVTPAARGGVRLGCVVDDMKPGDELLWTQAPVADVSVQVNKLGAGDSVASHSFRVELWIRSRAGGYSVTAEIADEDQREVFLLSELSAVTSTMRRHEGPSVRLANAIRYRLNTPDEFSA